MAEEEEADRSLVVGPAGRWLFIGDSAGSTETADPEGFDGLSCALSHLGAIVDVHMSDSAAVHFCLYRQGQMIDKFGNAKFPFYRFENEEEAAPFRGKPELWADLLVSPDRVDGLRSAWVQEWKACETLAETADLLGWDADLLGVGYTFDDEGLPTKYDEYFEDSEVQLDAFNEYHFKRLE